jgi:putative ABC transport system permease protein
MMSRRKERELEDELRAHLEMAARDRVERGEDPADARAAARREFGNVALVQEVTRDIWGWTWIERLGQDLRYAGRLLRRQPGFAAVAVLSLAIGIGANAAIFTMIDAVRLRTLPVARPEELAEITTVSLDGARGTFSHWRPSLTNPIWEQIRDRQNAFSGTLAFGSATFNLADGGEAQPAEGLWVSGGFFDVLGVAPAAGRLFTPADDRRGCAARAVISHRFWQRHFNLDRSVVGRTLRLDSRDVEILGVAAPGFSGLEVGRTFDVAVPICAEPALTGGPTRLDSGTDWWLIVMGRLAPGVTIDQASARLGGLSPGIFKETLAANYPAVSVPKYLAMTLRALPAATGISSLREQYESPLLLLFALAAVVLLVACANLANLLLARANARQREIAVRLGLGASRRRIVRQLMTESVVLAVLGAAVGLVLARVLGDALVALVDGNQNTIVIALGLNWRVLGFTIGLAAATCLLFGLAPAIRATRDGAGAAIPVSGRGVVGVRHAAGTGRVLVVVQVALSLALVVSALLFTRTLRNLATVDPGFARSGVLMTAVDFRRLQLPPAQRTAYKATVLERLRAIPGVAGAATTSITPVSGDAWGNDVTVARPSGPKTVGTRLNRVSDRYFATTGTPLVAGRDFDQRDTMSSTRVAIVNQAFARGLLEGGAAVGSHFSVEPTPTQPRTEYEIVGVAADAKYLNLREVVEPVAYFPASQDPRPSSWMLAEVRSTIDPSALSSAIVQSVRELNPNVGLSFELLERDIDHTLLRERLMATLSVFFGSIAAGLAIIGLYAVIAYGVMRRRNEIGVRMALGASGADVARMVLGEAGVLIAIGLAAGLALSLSAAGAAGTLLFGLSPRDPASMTVAAVLLGGVALAASYLPARAASRIEPTVALRIE